MLFLSTLAFHTIALKPFECSVFFLQVYFYRYVCLNQVWQTVLPSFLLQKISVWHPNPGSATIIKHVCVIFTEL